MMVAPKAFSGKDEKLIHLLIDMQIPRNLARTIVFFSKHNSCICSHIQDVTDLRQPEVSMAMQHMKDRGWIRVEPIRREYKGRPVLNYKLAVPFDTIIRTIIKEEREKIKSIREKIGDLRALTK